jgi:hypothetical protein
MLSFVMLSVAMLSVVTQCVVMLSVVMLIVVAPYLSSYSARLNELFRLLLICPTLTETLPLKLILNR